MPPSPDISWRIAPEPAVLTREEFRARYDHPAMPEKFEVSQGKLFWHDDQRLHVLAMLLEAVGLQKALSLCPPETIRAALENRKAES